MTDADKPDSLEEARLLQRLQDHQARDAAEPSPAHDAAVLGAAHAVARGIEGRTRVRRRASAWWPLSVAAALVLGIALGRGSWLVRDVLAPPGQLTLPGAAVLRGAPGIGQAAPVAVERADPAAWYRYIQELVFSGQVELAEEHLRRFRELHPDFVYQP